MTFKELLAVVDERTKIKILIKNFALTHYGFAWKNSGLYFDRKIANVFVTLENIEQKHLLDLQDHRCDFNDDVDVAFSEDDYEMGIITFDKILAVRLCEK